MSKVTFVTYTHSNCIDVWNAYFSRLDKHSKSSFDSYVLCNVDCNQYPNHKFVVYDDAAPYGKEYIKALNSIPHEYFIYMQEDFILYDNLDFEQVERYINILEVDQSISYVRMIKCGDVTQTKYADNLYYISQNGKKNQSINSFSMQPTIWRKKDFISLYELVNPMKFGEGLEFAMAMNQLNMNGLYAYGGESARGGHFDTNVFPYVATAIVKGKWNVSEYPDELKQIFKEFHINPNLRGLR